MPCYITGAQLSSPNLKRIVLVFTDVFGYEAGNHKLFADTLASRLGAAKGTVAVLVPDLFRGNPIAQPILNAFLPDAIGILATLPAFLYRIRFKHPPEVIERELKHLIFPWVQGQIIPNLDEIGASCVGFCFGGWVVARSLGLPSSSVPMKCGVGIHPSFQVEAVHHWGGDETELIQNMGAKPILLLPAGNDSPNLKVGGKHTKTLAEARNVPEDTISKEFPEMKHGWVSRGDGTLAGVAKCQEEAMDATVKFLEQNHV